MNIYALCANKTANHVNNIDYTNLKIIEEIIDDPLNIIRTNNLQSGYYVVELKPVTNERGYCPSNKCPSLVNDQDKVLCVECSRIIHFFDLTTDFQNDGLSCFQNEKNPGDFENFDFTQSFLVNASTLVRVPFEILNEKLCDDYNQVDLELHDKHFMTIFFYLAVLILIPIIYFGIRLHKKVCK